MKNIKTEELDIVDKVVNTCVIILISCLTLFFVGFTFVALIGMVAGMFSFI